MSKVIKVDFLKKSKIPEDVETNYADIEPSKFFNSDVDALLREDPFEDHKKRASAAYQKARDLFEPYLIKACSEFEGRVVSAADIINNGMIYREDYRFDATTGGDRSGLATSETYQYRGWVVARFTTLFHSGCIEFKIEVNTVKDLGGVRLKEIEGTDLDS